MRFLLSLAAVGLMATSAHAQSWSGCYGGAFLGYSSTLAEASGFGTSVDFGDDGVTYGGVAGCDVQMKTVVIGGWGDYSWDQGTIDVLGFKAGVNNRWALGGRAGVLINAETLLYGKIGWTQADIDFVGTHEGMVYGGGAEFKVSGPVYLQADYSYVDLNDLHFGPITINPDQHVVRAAITFKLNSVASPFSNSLK